MSDLADMAREELAPPEENPRRNFLIATAAVVLGGIVTIFPFLAGLGALFDPLRRKAAKAESLRITTLDTLPADGVPRAFPVIDTRVDAWNLYPPEAIGSVYLKREAGEERPVCWTTACPHVGCAIDFKGESNIFACPCHESAFDLNGNVIMGPSPRPMDTLEVEIRDDNEVWVKFQKFRSSKLKKIPEE